MKIILSKDELGELLAKAAPVLFPGYLIVGSIDTTYSDITITLAEIKSAPVVNNEE